MYKFLITENEKIQILSMYLKEQTNVSSLTSGYTNSSVGTDVSKFTSGYGQKTKGTDISSITSSNDQKTKGTDVSSFTSGYRQPVSGTTAIGEPNVNRPDSQETSPTIVELSSRDSKILSDKFVKIINGVKDNKLQTIYDGLYTSSEIYGRPQLKNLYSQLDRLYKNERTKNRPEVSYKKNWVTIIKDNLGYIRRSDKISLSSDVDNLLRSLK